MWYEQTLRSSAGAQDYERNLRSQSSSLAYDPHWCNNYTVITFKIEDIIVKDVRAIIRKVNTVLLKTLDDRASRGD